MATKAQTSRSTGTRTTGRATAAAKRATAKAAPANDAAGTALIATPIKAVKRTARSSATKVTSAATTVRKTASNAVGKAKRSVSRALPSAPSRSTTRLVGAAAAGVVAGLAVNFGRKALVQAPSLLAGDWLEALKAEHKMTLALFDALEKTTDAQKVKRSTLLAQLKHALGKHAFTEENVIYPALREAGEIEEADHLNHDHGYVKQYLFELDETPRNSPEFLRKVSRFRADLERHIREEEDKIFPAVHQRLTDSRNKALTLTANKEGLKLA